VACAERGAPNALCIAVSWRNFSISAANDTIGTDVGNSTATLLAAGCSSWANAVEIDSALSDASTVCVPLVVCVAGPLSGSCSDADVDDAGGDAVYSSESNESSLGDIIRCSDSSNSSKMLATAAVIRRDCVSVFVVFFFFFFFFFWRLQRCFARKTFRIRE
jgi:hypothetical protein